MMIQKENHESLKEYFQGHQIVQRSLESTCFLRQLNRKHDWAFALICFNLGCCYSATNSTGAPKMVSQSQVTFTTKALVVCKPIKNENISLNFKLGFFGGPG